MSSLFIGLNTANQTIQADQLAVQTIDHNVANGATPGYSMQSVNLVESPPYTIPSIMSPAGPGQIGSGVTVQSITRGRDALLDAQYRYQDQFAGQWSTLDTQYTQIQGILNEPATTGISTALSTFFNNWQTLADDPTNAGSRSALQQSAVSLTSTLNNSSQQLTQAQTYADSMVQNSVSKINSDATQIANLNGQIRAVLASGQQPNDLMDQRDLLIDQISNMVPIITTQGTVQVTATLPNGSLSTTTQPDGTINIQIATQIPGQTTLQVANAGVYLVQGINSVALNYTAMQTPSYSPQGNETFAITTPTSATPVNNTNFLVQVNSTSGPYITNVQYSTNGGQSWTSVASTSPTSNAFLINGYAVAFTTGSKNPTIGDQVAFSTGGTGIAQIVSQSATSTGTPGTETMSLSGVNSLASTNYLVKVVSVASGAITGIQYSTNGGTSWSTTQTVSNGTTVAVNGTTLTFTSGGSPAINDQFSFATDASKNPSFTTQNVASTAMLVPGNEVPANATNTMQGGQLGASLQLRDVIIGGTNGFIAKLNNVAQALALAVNQQHAQGFNYYGQAGGAFFNVMPPATSLAPPYTSVSGVTAANISVDPSIIADSNNIAAASQPNSVGDGSNAQAIANIKSLAGATGTPLQNQTIQQGYDAIIAQVGAQAQQAHNANQNQSSLMNTLTSQRQQIGGVSIDEQMTQLIQFQHSYESAAHIITTVDSLLNTIINHMGLGN